ncbi:integrator complex subunit 2-domain-containing protein [Chlamydoabsidia padenii]|nr:integrator complex subunit 2-domain-containing protein [Chlamydoabsidia padenii]
MDKTEQVLLNAKNQPDSALKLLSNLQTVPLEDMQTCAKLMISTLLLPCLDSDMDPRIVDAFISTWEYYHLSIPHEIWLWTINTLNNTHHQTATYKLDDLIRSPLLVFQADQRIFRSEKLLLLWLHSQINGRNVMALVNAQDTAILQLLLELCQEKKDDEQNKDALITARKLICRFIHGVFIDDRDSLLTKAFHFQTYATNLIPIMVDLVPSMFIAHSFLSELTRQPQLEKQVFGVILGCHLCEKYPTEIYRSLAEKTILPRLLKIAFPASGPPTSATGQQQCTPSEYLLQIIPAYKHLACAFPHFGQQILKALQDVQVALPAGPQAFMGNEGNNKIILFLQLHKVLKETVDEVTIQIKQKNSVNKSLMVV